MYEKALNDILKTPYTELSVCLNLDILYSPNINSKDDSASKNEGFTDNPIEKSPEEGENLGIEWLEGLCSQPACSDNTISDAIKRAMMGCETDLTMHGFDNRRFSQEYIEYIAKRVYATFRKMSCLKEYVQFSTLAHLSAIRLS
jgi:hypothetical protein